MLNEFFTMNNGNKIPKVGLGTWQTPDGDVAEKSVKYALEAGYRHIDTARVYGNEVSVGKAINTSGIKREEIFLTSKVPAETKTYEGAVKDINTSFEALGVDYIDLMLIHAPKPWSEMYDPKKPDRYHDGNVQVFNALIDFYKKGKIKAIGVSNFNIEDIKNITDNCELKPMVNQIRICIGDTKDDVVRYCQENDIIVEGYSPLATGRILDNKDLKEIADKLGVTLPQLCIKYLLEKDILPLPKSTHKEYIIANAKLDFTIGEENMKVLDAMKDIG